MRMSSSTFHDRAYEKEGGGSWETDTTEIVLVSALIENQDDVRATEKGLISETDVRRIEIHDARVDTGATYVSMPRRFIDQLGLDRIKTIHAKTVAGMVPFGIYSQVKLTIQGRECEVPRGGSRR